MAVVDVVGGGGDGSGGGGGRWRSVVTLRRARCEGRPRTLCAVALERALMHSPSAVSDMLIRLPSSARSPPSARPSVAVARSEPARSISHSFEWSVVRTPPLRSPAPAAPASTAARLHAGLGAAAAGAAAFEPGRGCESSSMSSVCLMEQRGASATLARPEASFRGHGEPPGGSGCALRLRRSGLSLRMVQAGRWGAVLKRAGGLA